MTMEKTRQFPAWDIRTSLHQLVLRWRNTPAQAMGCHGEKKVAVSFKLGTFWLLSQQDSENMDSMDLQSSANKYIYIYIYIYMV